MPVIHSYHLSSGYSIWSKDGMGRKSEMTGLTQDFASAKLIAHDTCPENCREGAIYEEKLLVLDGVGVYMLKDFTSYDFTDLSMLKENKRKAALAKLTAEEKHLLGLA